MIEGRLDCSTFMILRKHRRTKITIAIVVVVLLLLAGAIYLRKKAPPEAARLLPESDGIVYLNLRPLRVATHFDQHPVDHSPEYQQFIDATGIEFERDLDEVAFALHRMPNPNGPNGVVAFSEVFSGHFDGRRLAHYLEGAATSQENYAGHVIYSLSSDGRTVRVALIGYDMVAVSNAPTSEQIHSMLDRYRTAALPFSGSSLLSEHYSDIPLLSAAWGIGQIGLPLSDGNRDLTVLGVSLPLPVDATFVASVVWLGRSLHLRVEEIAPSETAAAASKESLETILNFVRTAGSATPANTIDQDTLALLNSTKIDQRKNRTVMTATVPPALLEKLVRPQASMNDVPLSGKASK